MIGTAERHDSRTPRAGKTEPPIRVTHVITSLATGGAEMMLLKLIRSSDRERFRSSVIALQGEGLVGSMMRDAGTPVRALDLNLWRAPAGIWRLARELRRQRPQIVQTWMYHADLFGGLASLALPGTPVVWNIRCGRPDRVLHKRATLWTSRACAAISPVLPARIICCSHSALASHAAAGYAPSKMQVIPNGFDTDEFCPEPACRISVREELGLAHDAVLAGMMARFDAAKDHRNFCNAAAIVHRADPRVHFALCGPGVSPDNLMLKRWIEEAGIAGCCHLLGLRRDVPRILASLDMVVSSSLFEGFSNVLGEAMACAVPCVATDSGDSRRILGESGYVVPVRDPQALAAKVLALAGLGADLRRQMGAAARRRVIEKFSLAAVTRQYESAYQELASRCAA